MPGRNGAATPTPPGCGTSLRSLACWAVKKDPEDEAVVIVNAANLDFIEHPLRRENDPAGYVPPEPGTEVAVCSSASGASCCGASQLGGERQLSRPHVDRFGSTADDGQSAEDGVPAGEEDEVALPVPASTPASARGTPSGSCSRPVAAAEAPDAEVLAAAEGGRWLEVQRLLAAHPERSPDAATLERARRIAQRYGESLQELRCEEDFKAEGGAWTEEFDPDRDLAFAFRLTDSAFQVVSSRVYERFDAFQAFVGLCEYDLRKEYDSQVLEAEALLGSEQEAPTDTIWRVSKRAHGGTEDNVWQVSCVDALDEPLGALWFSTYTPAEEGLAELRGVELPPPRGGAVRVGLWRTAYAVVPLWTAVPSFRLTFALCRRPSSAAYIFSSVLQKEIGAVLDNFGDFLLRCRDLNWRAVSSERAGFYERVRRHLEALAPQGCLAGAASPLLRLAFEELSALLPEDWADHAEEAEAARQEPCHARAR